MLHLQAVDTRRRASRHAKLCATRAKREEADQVRLRRPRELGDRSRCWFARTVLEVKLAYGLTVDESEAAALDTILARCENTAMEPIACDAPANADRGAGAPAPTGDDALTRYDDNGNGGIACKEAERHWSAPVHRSHAAYRYMRDGDGDGVVCE